MPMGIRWPLIELVNWQVMRDGHMEFVTVGHYDASAPDGQVLIMNRDITWAGGQPQVISNSKVI
uniref:Uncharacterized protein n=1 Tax=Anguilla anguilla TaxID=7936 RepID=A0A0E9R4M8_ANGAN